jgi:ABC-type bacteriocin/lantibiotic exporter with double-glycine peptidase domain
MARFRDLDNSINSTISLVNSLIMNTMQLLIFPPILLYINWKLALISLAVLPFDTILVMVSKRYLSRASLKVTEAAAESSAISFESLSGIRTVQALGMETTFYQRMRSIFIKMSRSRIHETHLDGGFEFVGVLIATTGTLICIDPCQGLRKGVSLGYLYMGCSGTEGTF